MIRITDGTTNVIRLGGGGGIQISGPSVPSGVTLTATTTAPSQTVTLQRVTPTGGTCVVSWGDGSADSTIANGNTGTTTHVYAAAGAWPIVISNASLMTYLDLRDEKLSWTVGPASPMPTGLTYLYLISLAGLTWTVGGAGATMPTGLTYLYLYNLAGLTWTVGGAGATMPTGLTSLTYHNSLTQAAVNAALWGFYQGTTTRTATGGTINVGGTNAAPSGTFQAPASCPVTVATPGKEVAHALLNDGCAVGFNRWTTVTTS